MAQSSVYEPEADEDKKPPAPYDPNKPPPFLTPPTATGGVWNAGGAMPVPQPGQTDISAPLPPPTATPDVQAPPTPPSPTAQGGMIEQPGSSATATDTGNPPPPPVSQTSPPVWQGPGSTPTVPMPPPVPGATWSWVPNQAGTMWVPSNHPTANTTWKPTPGQTIPQNTGAIGATQPTGAGATDNPPPTGGIPPNQPSPGTPKPFGQGQSPLVSDLENFLRRRMDPTGTGRAPGVDRNSVEFRSQADPYAAAIERQKRAYLDDAAERNSSAGLGESGAMDLERRMAAERAGQQIGTFESDLARSEMERQRAEMDSAIKDLKDLGLTAEAQKLEQEKASLDAALKREGYQLTEREGIAGREMQKYTSDLSALLTREGRTFEGGENEKQRTLQSKLAEIQAATAEKGFKVQKELADLNALLTREGRTFEGGENEKNRLLEKSLADLDAAIKRESLAQTGQLGREDLALREKLGMGGLNVDLFRALLGDVQFNKDLAARLGISEAELELRLRELLMR